MGNSPDRSSRHAWAHYRCALKRRVRIYFNMLWNKKKDIIIQSNQY